jgi:hypothetical protein
MDAISLFILSSKSNLSAVANQFPIVFIAIKMFSSSSTEKKMASCTKQLSGGEFAKPENSF